MTPVIVMVIGFFAIVICAIILKKTGTAAWNRKMREEISKDAKRFGTDDTIGK